MSLHKLSPRIDRSDKLFFSAIFSAPIISILNIANKWYTYYSKEFFEIYSERIAQLHLESSKIQEQRIINTLLETVYTKEFVIFLLSLFICYSLWLRVMCESRKSLRPNQSKFDNEWILDFFLYNQGNDKAKNTFLLRFDTLDEEKKQKLIDKIELELRHAPLEIAREDNLLKNNELISACSRADTAESIHIELLKKIEPRREQICKEIEVIDDQEVRTKRYIQEVYKARINKNKLKELYYPMLLELLSGAIDRKSHYLSFGKYTKDILSQIFFLSKS